MRLHFKDKAFRFICFHSIVVLLFAILYWIAERIVKHFPSLAKDYDLGKAGYPASFFDCLFFSAITQSTIGYGVPKNIHDAGKNNLVHYINFIQVMSIFIIVVISLN